MNTGREVLNARR